MVNGLPKFVGSSTLSGDLEWNATLLEGDLADSIPKVKDEVDGDLFMHGSGEFAYALAEKGLIDEYEVYLNPLVWARETSTCSATGEPSGWSSTTWSGSTPEWFSSPTTRRREPHGVEAGGIEPPLQVCKTCVLPLPLRPRDAFRLERAEPRPRRRSRR